VTYANKCELLRAGVRLDHFGPCGEGRCGSNSTGSNACDPGFFCELPPEVCTRADAEGICLPIPENCTDEYEPVCGCNGVTYSNDCDRRANGVPLLHRGECRELCGGFAGVPCDPGEFCDLPPKMCEGADLQGHCVALPDACPAHVEPVCGCDGVSYPNNCERVKAGAQLHHFGPCHVACDPTASTSCGDNAVCLSPPGHCDLAHEAICVPRPLECEPDSVPVCGCDGTAYSSPCEALRAGVGIANEGPCG
jgi:hypothetical protein